MQSWKFSAQGCKLDNWWLDDVIVALKKLQECMSTATLKILHSFYHKHKFVTLFLLPSKAQKHNLQFRPMLRPVKVNTSGSSTGFRIQRSHVQNHWVTPRSTQPFIFPRSIKWAQEISGDLVKKKANCLHLVALQPWGN